jgi:hypothetical protein
MQMILPTIHLNGTSRESLLEGYQEAIDALVEAGRKVAAAGPNGRDYYVQGNKAFPQAMDEHEARLTKIRKVILELEAIAVSL